MKQGVTEVSFSSVYSELVVYRPGQEPAVKFGFEWGPWEFSWSKLNAGSYRYFVCHSKNNPGRYLFQYAPCVVRLVQHSGEWWLFENKRQCMIAAAQ